MKEKMSDSLIRYIDAGRPLIYINHFDFETVDRMLAEAFPKATIAEYCDADGWVDFKTKQPHGSTPYTLPEFLMLFNNDQLYQASRSTRFCNPSPAGSSCAEIPKATTSRF